LVPKACIIAIAGALGQWPEVTIVPVICDGFAMVPALLPPYPYPIP